MKKIVLVFTLFFNAAFTDPGYLIEFTDVSMAELVRFISRISKQTFIYDDHELDFKVSVNSGNEIQPPEMIALLLNVAKKHGCSTKLRSGTYTIERKLGKYAGLHRTGITSDGDYTLYKLQYNLGSEIIGALKGADFSSSSDLKRGIDAMQWIESTNSILLSGKQEVISRLISIIQNLDQQQKQVFIEVLVIETNIRNGLDFGLEWAAGGDIKSKVGFAMGSAQPPFSKTFQSINATNKPTGPDQIPMGKGFDLGIIGDLILHKGKTFFSLANLIHALETDGDSKIILNQKMVAQDGKSSTFFVGDNIPFPGAVVETIGAAQQTTANLDYRDVGVSLKITPFLGGDDVITLDISEEITEATREFHSTGGISTTKTNMITKVHVPDKSFVVLSGMNKNKKVKRREGIPCLGSLPLIGGMFSRTKDEEEKRNVLIFVRPRMLHNMEEMKEVAHDSHV